MLRKRRSRNCHLLCDGSEASEKLAGKRPHHTLTIPSHRSDITIPYHTSIRRAAAPEAVDANRILSSAKRKNILPIINTAAPPLNPPNPNPNPNPSATSIGMTSPAASKPSTPTQRSRLDSRAKSIRFAGEETNPDLNDNASNTTGSAMTPMSEKPPSPSASSIHSSRSNGAPPPLLRRASTKRALIKRQSSRMSQRSDVSGTTAEGEKKEETTGEGGGAGTGEGGNDGDLIEALNVSADSAGSNAEWLPNVSSTILRKQKPKFRLEPLPVTDFPKFRIFDYQMKENVVLIQGFATMLKLFSRMVIETSPSETTP